MSLQIENRIYTVPLDGKYLLERPDAAGEAAVLVVTLHGFASNAEVMLRLSRGLVGPDCVVASIQAPNQQYLAASPAAQEVGYNWGTRQHGEWNIRLHHDIVRTVLGDLRARFGIPARRTLLMGFSQPVGLNYRFVGTYPDQVGAVLGICGGVPKDWQEDKYHRVTAPVMHIARSEDEFFPAAVTQGFPERLRRHVEDVEFHLMPGGHRFPSKAITVVQPWMDRVFGARC